ncbi:hypothetical protein AGRA3207_007860 (plasmid) [Actinomadura graeca]|uniref:Helix-turn-helix domain-containing protein n=1 Tax=Actinomadura graeca TaxID=2750812 RepID=A0ABX8R897_9ACTN|nr:hypothetical protein [Actinomadura graeca]QXJ27063.1 hypothetical protein AGRA3207_007860 [Actinomadura graeca]
MTPGPGPAATGPTGPAPGHGAAELAEARRARAVAELAGLARERRALEDRTRPAVLAARAAGVPVRRVAELAEVSPDTVNRWTAEAARDLLAAGGDVADVARQVGAREGTVRRWATERQDQDGPGRPARPLNSTR